LLTSIELVKLDCLSNL